MVANSIDALILDIDRREARPPVVYPQPVTNGEAWFHDESPANGLADYLRVKYGTQDVVVAAIDGGRGGYSVQWSVEDIL
jgi:hypothetical protein